MDVYVIGSGPAGVSCATALLARGFAVTMLDAGATLEDSGFDNNYLRMKRYSRKDPIKTIYGSYFPYAEVQNYFPIESDVSINCLPSFAQGGLSNVWGSFVEQYSENTFRDWPIGKTEMEPYYDKAFSILNTDKKATVFKSSKQAVVIKQTYEKNMGQLKKSGFDMGFPALAVDFSMCKYCGLCQSGCPEHLIYSSVSTLEKLIKQPGFKYIKNVVVERVSETSSYVEIKAVNRKTRQLMMFNAERAFLACGPVISTKLVMEGGKQAWNEAKFIDSSHFILPCYIRGRFNGVKDERLHTLCQLYLKLNNSEVSNREINMQLYTYMDLFESHIKGKLGVLYRYIAPLAKKIIENMVVIQGHLHSDESHGFSMSLMGNKIRLSPIKNDKLNTIVARLKKHCKVNANMMGLYPLRPLFSISKICKSFHYGGSMPMSHKPDFKQSDLMGRPYGWRRLHVVDASIFPTIAAGSITLTIMANAYRIASKFDQKLES